MRRQASLALAVLAAAVAAAGLVGPSRPLASPLRRAAPLRPPPRMQSSAPAGKGGWHGRRKPPHAAAAAAPAVESNEALGLHSALFEHPRVVRGSLRNGLRYAILPNESPEGRFEAHLEMHVGSCEEADDEQGLAHLVEHVTFMGSRKRERLFSTGSKSNAYTDFHHTVYHFQCPNRDQSGRPLLPLALDALREIAFEPELLGSRIEKERKAILSELQMINTIDYRCSTMHLRELHSDNPLSRRFPIGREEQILQWDATHVRAFHATHYLPDVADLYIVGDVDPAQAERLIADAFRSVRGRPRSLAGLKRDERRAKPQLSHTWTLAALPPSTAWRGSVDPSADLPPPTVFKHELLQSFSLTLFAKEPVAKRARVSDLADFLTDRIVACCVARRLNKRERPNPPFTGVEFDVSDAPSEACVVSTFIVYADAAAERWERTVQRALGDLQLLSAHGLSCAEVEAMRAAILADSRLRAQQGATPSAELLSVMMESDCLGHTFVEPSHYDQALQLASEAVDDARVNSRMRDLISHITRYGEPDAPRPAAVVVCMPERGGDGVVDDRKLSARLDAMLRARAATASAALDVPTPSELIPPDVLDFRARATPPAWAGGPAEGGKELKCVDERSGAVIQLRRLANGVAVSTVRTASESDAVVLRLCAPGGRAAEDSSLPGALLLATATMLHGGSVGALSREQVELYCISHLIELNMEVTEEVVRWDLHCPVGERGAGLAAALELVHALIADFRWEPDALEYTRELYAAQHDARAKSLEMSATSALQTAVWGGDARFLEPTPATLRRLGLKQLERAMRRALATDRIELTVVGDFEPRVLDALLLRYVGTLPPAGQADGGGGPAGALSRLAGGGVGRRAAAPAAAPLLPADAVPRPDRSRPVQRMALVDSEPRAIAYIWGACTPRYPRAPGTPAAHPLRIAVALELLTELINSRLFSVLRDMLGLVYESCVRFCEYELLPANGFVVTISAAPAKVDAAHEAALSVLRDLSSGRQPPSEYDLNKARRAVLATYDSHAKDNSWWLAKLQHVCSGAAPGKDVRCVTDYVQIVEAMSVHDLREVAATLEVDDGEALSVIMASEPHPEAAHGHGRGGGGADAANPDGAHGR